MGGKGKGVDVRKAGGCSRRAPNPSPSDLMYCSKSTLPFQTFPAKAQAATVFPKRSGSQNLNAESLQILDVDDSKNLSFQEVRA